MKKKINVLLGICALLLLFICWRSIQDDQDFNATVEAREAVVKERLLQIRDAEEAYKQQSEEGEYCADWDVLINFIKTGKLPLVLKEGVLSDAQMEKGLTETKAAAIVRSGNQAEIAANGLEGFKRCPVVIVDKNVLINSHGVPPYMSQRQRKNSFKRAL